MVNNHQHNPAINTVKRMSWMFSAIMMLYVIADFLAARTDRFWVLQVFKLAGSAGYAVSAFLLSKRFRAGWLFSFCFLSLSLIFLMKFFPLGIYRYFMAEEAGDSSGLGSLGSLVLIAADIILLILLFVGQKNYFAAVEKAKNKIQ
jgi:hypothetical protein